MSASSSISWDSTAVENPFLLSLAPSDERLIPNHNITWDGWVVDDDPKLFNTQWIGCSYPISGSYGRAPRYLFYALILFAVLKRRESWIAGIALASAMTYSATAAIHAFALAVDRIQLVAQFRANNYQTVMVGGATTDGTWVDDSLDNWQQYGLWLPILPMVWDCDCEAILAIVGVAFLVLTPMQTWSSTFKKAEAKAVLLLWSLLLFVGLVCALVTEAYVFLVYFPQLRFCPLNSNDTLPFTNGGSGSTVITWNPYDIYQANRTITDYFTNSSTSIPTTCLYSCFTYVSSLRDQTDIVADLYGIDSGATNSLIWWLYLTIYLLVGSTGLSSLTIFAIQSSERLWKVSKSYSEFKGKWKAIMHFRPFLRLRTAKSFLAAF
jgi:hypothetical protein